MTVALGNLMQSCPLTEEGEIKEKSSCYKVSKMFEDVVDGIENEGSLSAEKKVKCAVSAYRGAQYIKKHPEKVYYYDKKECKSLLQKVYMKLRIPIYGLFGCVIIPGGSTPSEIEGKLSPFVRAGAVAVGAKDATSGLLDLAQTAYGFLSGSSQQTADKVAVASKRAFSGFKAIWDGFSGSAMWP